jgi:hypothetical protein
MSAPVNKWKLISGLLLVLVLGILVGSIATGFYLKHRFAPFARGSKAKETFIIEKLSRELNLTPTQKAKVAPIVKQMIEKRREYYVQIRPEVKGIMDQGFSQIKQELNEDQKKKLDALREKYERRRAERRAKRFRK